MRQRVVLLLILVLSMTLFAVQAKQVSSASPDSWIEKKPMPESRGRLGVAVVNGKIYAIGGDNGSVGGMDPSAWAAGTTAILDTNEEYDPETDTWNSRTPMPTARSHFGIAVYEDEIYCIGGQTRLNNSQSITGVNEVYDPVTDTWESRAPMPVPGRFQMANVVNGKIIVIGAVDNTLNQEYDPKTDSWTNKAEPPYQIHSCASATYDNELYFVGDSPSVSQQSILIYNPSYDSWSIGPVPPSYLTTASAGVTSGLYAPQRIYFFDYIVTYVFDPEKNVWSTGAAVPKARGFAGVAAVNDTFYVVGGVILPDGFGEMAPMSVNEQYIPIEYGTPDPRIKPFPITLVIGSVVAVVVVVGLGLLVYFKKRH